MPTDPPNYVKNIEENIGDSTEPLNSPSHPQHHVNLAQSISWLKSQIQEMYNTLSELEGTASDLESNKVSHTYAQENYAAFVKHGDDASVDRPSDKDLVIWVGSVEPDNAEDKDIWVSTED